jgi:uncharacterized protein (DUF305 family)
VLLSFGMTSLPTYRIGSALAAPFAAAVLGLAACGGTSRTEPGVSPEPAPAKGDIAAIARARADSARYPHTEADVHFMSAMIGHHAQAIVMSNWAPTHEASPAVRRLAERIINAQQDEIATMQRWLKARGEPVPEATPAGMKMEMGEHEHPSTGSGQAEMLMPGMLTEDQLRQLDQARGAEFDRLFLTFMIQHHKGAVSMVQDLFSSRGAAQDDTVFKFANDVSVDQATEIKRMEKMLAPSGAAAGSR